MHESPASGPTGRVSTQMPWLMIAILGHVAIAAVASILYQHSASADDDTPPTEIRLTRRAPEIAPTPIEIVDRDRVPEFQIDEPTLDTTTTFQAEPDDAASDLPSEIDDAASLVGLPMPEGGSTAIAPGVGFANWAPPSPHSGPGGPHTGRFNKPGKPGPGGNTGPPGNEQVLLGLAWLARHQDEDGRWDADQFMKHDTEGDPCSGPGNGANDVGVTALALLAFLGEGNTMRIGAYRKVVRKGVRWLVEQQEDSGRIGNGAAQSSHYSHAIATLVLCEAYGLSDFEPLRQNAQAAVNYITAARNPYGVWRYEPRSPDGDTSVSAWMVQALLSAKEFELTVDDTALRTAMVWFDGVTDPATGVAGYTKLGEGSSRPVGKADRFPADRSEALTSAVVLCRYLSHQQPKDTPVMQRAIATIASKPPKWDEKDGSIDMYYWYYGSYAMYQVGGAVWDAWARCLTRAAVETQQREGNRRGSWDPIDPWGEDGGRVYSTAIMVLCLEAYYRYSRVQGGR